MWVIYRAFNFCFAGYLKTWSDKNFSIPAIHMLHILRLSTESYNCHYKFYTSRINFPMNHFMEITEKEFSQITHCNSVYYSEINIINEIKKV